MGSSLYSDATYSARISYAKDKGVDVFTHTDDVKSGRTDAKAHEKLDPSKPNKAGLIVRESRDSETHPVSRAVVVMFDVTGSMGVVPRLFIEKLDKLMGFLVKKGFIEHPHILFGAIGDATCDSAPLQVGQFEAGNEMDEALSLILLEGGGGGSIQESYELGMYFLARHTDMDCLNKRGEKGYCFILGDETPYGKVKRSEVKRLIGDDLQADIPTEEILAELREKFEVFWILPANTNHANDHRVIEPMKTMFGQNYLRLEKPEDVCELIASTIGISEGFDIHDITAGLKDIGADAGSIGRASEALVAYAGKSGLTKATVSGSLPVVASSDNVSRL